MQPDWETALASTVTALRTVAGSTLPLPLGQRFLDLSERKEELGPEEQDELIAWVAFTQQRSVEIAAAEVALRRLVAVCPESGKG